MSSLCKFVFISFVLFGTSTAFAAPLSFSERVIHEIVPTQQLKKAIQSGGYILYMRHAMTDHSKKDNHINTFESCRKQRNLSLQGREQATKIGEAMKALNIPIGKVFSSPFCRCKDTAKLSFGQYSVDQNLQFSMTKDKAESKRLGDYLYQLMKKSKVDSMNMVLVGHTSNLRDGLGVWPQPEGVITVFQKRKGKIFFKGKITPNDWLQH